MSHPMPADALKTRLKAASDASPQLWRTRLHRSISWLRRAELETDDDDARFIFLWVAFNAAYACEFDVNDNERARLRRFIDKLLALDTQCRLHHLVFAQFSGSIRTLIENKYVFEPFWRALRDHDSSGQWEESFVASRKAATASVLANDTGTVLSIVFDRLYVLRNQLVHGGATWNSRLNRAQVKDGAAILGKLTFAIVDLMLEYPDADFGEIFYPPV